MTDVQLNSLVSLRAHSLRAIRRMFDSSSFVEVSPTAITNFGGVCEDIESLFALEYYGQQAYLAQTAQLQLEYLVSRLHRSVWTTGHSFRYEKKGTALEAYLSEFTLIELEVFGATLKDAISIQMELVRAVLREVLEHCVSEIAALGGSVEYLKRMSELEYSVITYGQLIESLKKAGEPIEHGDNLGRRHERAALTLDNRHWAPVFVTHCPSAIKYFNMKRTEDESIAINVDLLVPPFGETSGGAEREVSGERLLRTFSRSSLPAAMERLKIPSQALDWYFDMFRRSTMPERAGFGLGFERFVAFILFNSSEPDRPVSIADCLEFPRTASNLVP